jgi:hypothetical protein
MGEDADHQAAHGVPYEDVGRFNTSVVQEGMEFLCRPGTSTPLLQ